MINKLTQQTVNSFVSLEVSENKKAVAIFYQTGTVEMGAEKIAEFHISSVWDVIRDAVITADVGPLDDPGLFRRKGEALAGALHTNELFNDLSKGEE